MFIVCYVYFKSEPPTKATVQNEILETTVHTSMNIGFSFSDVNLSQVRHIHVFTLQVNPTMESK